MDTALALRVDVATARVLVWIASRGRDVELTDEANLYFADRYQRLADWHRAKGHQQRARVLQAKADDFYRRGGGDGPPFAAAMGMPRPTSWTRTNAVSTQPWPPDAA